jgi:hypothetical protein
LDKKFEGCVFGKSFSCARALKDSNKTTTRNRNLPIGFFNSPEIKKPA